MLPTLERDILDEAHELLKLIELETGRDVRSRLTDIEAELMRTGTYRHTVDELEHGSRVAWRNNPRCIARFHWRTLQVRDMRDLEHEDQIFDAIVEHLRLSTNRGRIRPLITVFPPRQPGGDGWRIWNHSSFGMPATGSRTARSWATPRTPG